MFGHPITYEDFNGNTVTKEFYFHLNKADMLGMIGEADAMRALIEQATAAKDPKRVIDMYKKLLRAAAGIRSEDGQRFIKTEEAQSHLFDTPALDTLIFDLMTDPAFSVDFVNKLIPPKLMQELTARGEQMQKHVDKAPDPFAEPVDNRPAYMREHRLPTQEELVNMTPEQLQVFMQNRPSA